MLRTSRTPSRENTYYPREEQNTDAKPYYLIIGLTSLLCSLMILYAAWRIKRRGHAIAVADEEIESNYNRKTASEANWNFDRVNVILLEDQHFGKNDQSQLMNIFDDSVHRGGVIVLPGDRQPAPNLCAICISQFIVSETLVWSPNPACEHVFHKTCMEQWCEKKTLCPCCRQEFLITVPEERSTDDDISGTLSTIAND